MATTHDELSDTDRLRAAGLRVTAQRIAVLDALRTRPHATAEIVHGLVRDRVPGIALPTVHSVLGDLTAAGIVSRVSLPDSGSALYELQHDNHHHLQCVSCGRVEDVDCAVGAAPCLHPSRDHGMRILEAAVTYRAICPECERKLNG
ncbi:Fur family transcriptional regulator [Microbacterium pseudoresistens]|uniref:Fur family ferric uptake transcriptional regulator n=1 Tax=Microbacterium pseudoresistens TaxID=640634 RepID=A0A7Y9EW30_9MICO|nr:Fur family transcriptional regulator [Microbacterium pseudoresistens]NYD54978.1 Fur family ferric uptake transcriptional regulator [Microbacterium pseudoresistens]